MGKPKAIEIKPTKIKTTKCNSKIKRLPLQEHTNRKVNMEDYFTSVKEMNGLVNGSVDSTMQTGLESSVTNLVKGSVDKHAKGGVDSLVNGGVDDLVTDNVDNLCVEGTVDSNAHSKDSDVHSKDRNGHSKDRNGHSKDSTLSNSVNCNVYGKNNKLNMNCSVIGLENINELAKKYRGKLNLSLTSLKTVNKKEGTSSNPEIKSKLAKWEMELSWICILDPVIAVENLVDDEGPPEDFIYVRNNLTNPLADQLLDPSFLVGCECEPRCSLKKCVCPLNGNGQFAYDRKKRVLLPIGSPIYECNSKCKCSQDCPNRVIQKGLTVRVCIFRTSNGRGWGLKAREFIPAGKFVVEYVGEIITSEEAERRGKYYDVRQQTYLFDLDFDDKDAMFTIDAYRYGNVSHFINHSCDPNLHVYSVWVETLDPRLPRIGLFAKRDIYVSEELTFDYMMTSGYSESTLISPKKFNTDLSSSQNVSKAYCACGTAKCRKYLF